MNCRRALAVNPTAGELTSPVGRAKGAEPGAVPTVASESSTRRGSHHARALECGPRSWRPPRDTFPSPKDIVSRDSHDVHAAAFDRFKTSTENLEIKLWSTKSARAVTVRVATQIR